jgi:hypothetical protein
MKIYSDVIVQILEKFPLEQDLTNLRKELIKWSSLLRAKVEGIDAPLSNILVHFAMRFVFKHISIYTISQVILKYFYVVF